MFADLGLPNPEERLAKADLALAIAREIEAHRLTQAEAANLSGIAQPDISNLMRGRDVEIRVRRARAGTKRVHLRVAAG